MIAQPNLIVFCIVLSRYPPLAGSPWYYKFDPPCFAAYDILILLLICYVEKKR